MKFRFIPTNINSIDINRISKLRLFKTRPKTPIKKTKLEQVIKKFNEKFIFFYIFKTIYNE